MIFIISVRYLVPNLFCFTIFPLFGFLSRIIWHKSTWISKFIDIFIYNKCYLLSNALCIYRWTLIIERKKYSYSHLSRIIWYCMCMKLENIILTWRRVTCQFYQRNIKPKNEIFSRVKQLNIFSSESFWLCQRGIKYTSAR